MATGTENANIGKLGNKITSTVVATPVKIPEIIHIRNVGNDGGGKGEKKQYN